MDNTHKCEPVQWEGQIYHCKHCYRRVERDYIAPESIIMTKDEVLSFRIGCFVIILVLFLAFIYLK